MDHFSYVLDGVSKNYGSLQVLNEISLRITSGSIIVFIGANGAGKSTCMKILSGLMKPDKGKFYIERKNSDNQTIARHTIGYCPQEICIWPDLTLREQMTMVATLSGMRSDLAHSRVTELLQALDLTSKANVLASTLSGGMQRRLNLGLALVHNPELCILDEPLDGVDLPGRKLIREYIISVSSGKKQTIILSTHIIEEALLFNGMIVLFKKGKLIVFNSPDEVYQSVGSDSLEHLFSEQ